MTETKKTVRKTTDNKKASAKKIATKSSSSGAKQKNSTNSSKKSVRKPKTEFDEYKRKSDETDLDYTEFERSEERRQKAFKDYEQGQKVKDEIVIITSVLAAVIMILSYFNICGIIGKAVNCILFGFMGVFAYIFPFVFVAMSCYQVFNKNRAVSGKNLAFCIMSVICICSIIHIFTIYDDVSFFGSFKEGFVEKRGGGFLGEIMAWPLCHLFGKVAAVIIEIVLVLICFMMLSGKAVLSIIKQTGKKEYDEYSRKRKESNERKQLRTYERNLELMEEKSREQQERKPKVYAAGINSSNPTVGQYVPKKRNNESFLERLRSDSFTGTKDYKPENEKKCNSAENLKAVNTDNVSTDIKEDKSGLDMVEIVGCSQETESVFEKEIYKSEMERKFGSSANTSVNVEHRYVPERNDYDDEPNYSEEDFVSEVFGKESLTNDEKPDAAAKDVNSEIKKQGNFGMRSDKADKSLNSAVFARGDYKSIKDKPTESHSLMGKQEQHTATPADNAVSAGVVRKAPRVIKPYKFPPISLLKNGSGGGKTNSAAELRETARKLQDTLKSFGVNVTILNISCGPSVTRYELQPEQGVKVSKITSLADDIKLNLAASDIRIEAPIPGKAAIGIEVPNKSRQTVALGTLINSEEFKNSKSPISFAIGKDLGGQVVVENLKEMPHLLIAGATGSGKSVCINTLIMSIIYKSSPDDVKLILIDPKVVELSVYNGIPHLLIPVVTDPKKASGALNWAVMEMTDRYKKFAELGVREIEGYNKRIESMKEPEKSSSGEIYEKMPKIVIVIDELADLMMVAPGEVEDYICRIAQLARAAGIHLVIATQRPSVNVITGLIKANIPSRIAFSVSSQIDSRTILDVGGAEKLLGKGDMLMHTGAHPKLVRVQGAYVSDTEVMEVVDFLKQNNENGYDEETSDKISKAMDSADSSVKGQASSASDDNDYDEHLYSAGMFIIQKEKASIGALQRQFKIGFNRAARIMDQLSEFGVVGPEEGTKPRQIIMSAEQFENFAIENGLK